MFIRQKGRILREGTTSELLTASELATHLALGPRQRPAENA